MTDEQTHRQLYRLAVKQKQTYFHISASERRNFHQWFWVESKDNWEPADLRRRDKAWFKLSSISDRWYLTDDIIQAHLVAISHETESANCPSTACLLHFHKKERIQYGPNRMLPSVRKALVRVKRSANLWKNGAENLRQKVIKSNFSSKQAFKICAWLIFTPWVTPLNLVMQYEYQFRLHYLQNTLSKPVLSKMMDYCHVQ